MVDLAWLDERLTSDNEETKVTWELFAPTNVHYKSNKVTSGWGFMERKGHPTLIVDFQKLMIGSGGTISLQILCI